MSKDMTKIVELARQYIRANVSRSNLNVKQIAAHCGVSRRVLERRFREVLSRSPLEEIVDVKIRCAKVMLQGTKLSIAEISRELGFADVKSLRFHFQTSEGMPPGQWRNKHPASTDKAVMSIL